MTTILNQAAITNLKSVLLDRNDVYNRWGNLVSSYLALPGLRGFWPGSAIGPGRATASASDLIDQSGLNNYLADTNTPIFGYSNLIPYVHYNGSTQYHSITDANSNNAFDIIGNEAYIETPGLTFGCWANFDTLAGSGLVNDLIAKFGAAGTRSYEVGYFNSAGEGIFCQVSGDGTSVFRASDGTVPSISTWYLVVGRYNPSTEVAVFLNKTKIVNTTSIPATLFNGTADLHIGNRSDNTNYFDGKLNMAFVCATVLSDAYINALYEQGRVLYNV